MSDGASLAMVVLGLLLVVLCVVAVSRVPRKRQPSGTPRVQPAQPTASADVSGGLTREEAPRARETQRGAKTELMHWAAVGDESRVRQLLDKGADIDAEDSDGDPALYYALSNENFDVVALLLDYQANPNVSGSSGSALRVAVDQGWESVASTLIRHGANVDLKSPTGLTTTMLAAGGGRDGLVELLHRHGAALDAVDSDGDSALFYAASRGRVGTVKLLLSLGANPDPQPGVHGETPLTVAASLAVPLHARPSGATGEDFTAIVLDLLRNGADAARMYDKRFQLFRQARGSGLELAPLESVSHYVHIYDDLRVGYRTHER